MLTTFNEIDMSGIMNLRKTYKVNIKNDKYAGSPSPNFYYNNNLTLNFG